MLTLYTIGHGNLSPEAFLSLLRQHGITTLVDVRSAPPVVDLAALNYANYLHQNKEMPLEAVADFLKRIFRTADEVWLRVGLTRPWQDDSQEVYSYIQIAGIHTFPDYLCGACFADFEPT